MSGETLSAADLRIWISAALKPLVGHEAVTDDDGDFPIPLETGGVFIRAVEDERSIHLFSTLVEDVIKTDYAAFLVQTLNRNNLMLKFFLVGDTIRLRAVLYADPPVESHLVRCLSEFEAVMGDGAAIAHDVGGRFAWDPDSSNSGDDDELPTPVQILIQLDSEGDEFLSPEEVARVCHHDAEAILAYIRTVEEQMINWRTRADNASAEGDAEEAAAASHEALAWEKTARDLRGALRHVALRP
ncbi:hypothetical protein [Gordonia sp. 'Campus']|uniref:T3SS (YopN, CesT) and YbjN peptide-binding chaperone 1 n=1 Tax=Gordonia sp. 'Campus' TaxID=2915824 RepID=UPI001EE40040|nr:hypothetical protein [Gordonia sp. 'Campus']